MRDNNQEMFPIVDEDGNILSAATRGECHSGSKLLHPVIHLHLFVVCAQVSLNTVTKSVVLMQ